MELRKYFDENIAGNLYHIPASFDAPETYAFIDDFKMIDENTIILSGRGVEIAEDENTADGKMIGLSISSSWETLVTAETIEELLGYIEKVDIETLHSYILKKVDSLIIV